MAMITLVCKTCGGKVELDETREFGFCKYCGNSIVIKSDIIQNIQNFDKLEKHVYGHEGKDVDELIADGIKLLELGNGKKANVKFKQAIDVDPNSWEAWLGYATTGGDNSGHLSCVPAYQNAYNAAADETQMTETFNDMVRYLPDRGLSDALINTYKNSPLHKRHEIFGLVLGVIGCDDSEIATLVTDLCPYDWRAWLAKAKIRQIRARWCDRRLDKNTSEVLNIFIYAYQLAKNESEAAKNTVLSYIATIANDNSYKNFSRFLHAQIKRIR